MKKSLTRDQVMTAIRPVLVSEEILRRLDPDVIATPLAQYAPDVAGDTDLFVVYKLALQEGVSRDALTKDALNMLHMQEDQFALTARLADAAESTKLCGMETVMENIQDGLSPYSAFVAPEEQIPDDILVIISNENGMLGNIRILDKESMRKIYDKRGPFYIVPSSIHECQAYFPIGNDDDADVQAFAAGMVQSINQAEVELYDQMSNGLYWFDGSRIQQLMAGSAAA